MTIKECYNTMNGNYEEALRRLMNDSLIQRFLNKFIDDKSFENLCAAMNARDYEQAFQEAHTLKGVSQNMSFTALSDAVSALTEELRGGKYTEAVPGYFEETKKQYSVVKQTILEYNSSLQ